MTSEGRPLRFLAGVMIGWTTLRLVMLSGAPEAMPTALDSVLGGVAEPTRVLVTLPVARPAARIVTRAHDAARAPIVAPPAAVPHDHAPPPSIGTRPRLEAPTFPSPLQATALPPAAAAPGAAPPPPRWSGSAWALARPGGGPGLAAAPQLGGSQAGIRLVRALSPGGRLAAAARLTTPLSGTGQELAAGIEWRPLPLPVRLVAEQRVALDRGTRGGTMLALVGGTNPRPLAGGFDLESYAAAGTIARPRPELFAEGQARLTRPVATLGKAGVALGLGAWGAAQRGATRVDIGPTLAAALPVAAAPVRLLVDWRQRIAGDARPGSGPALTLATDF